MKYLTNIQLVNDKFHRCSSSVEEIKSVKGGFIETTIEIGELVSDGNGAFESTTVIYEPKRRFINTSLIISIEEI